MKKRLKRLINGIVWGSPNGPLIIVNQKINSFAVLESPSWFQVWILRHLVIVNPNGEVGWRGPSTPNE